MANRDRIGSYLSTLLVGGALLAGAVMARGAATKTLEGTISDAMCGIKHKMPNAKQCTIGCVKMGSDYALIVGDKVYILKGGPAAELEKLAGEPAKVTGDVDGMTVHVASVAPTS